MMHVEAPDTISSLNRLFRIAYRSLPAYLQGIQLWFGPANHPGDELVARIAADHRVLAGQFAEAIRKLGGVVDVGEFPIEFTSFNDLDVAFILRKIRQRIGHAIPILHRTVDELTSAPSAQALAEHMLRLTLEHQAAIAEMVKTK